MRHAKQTLSKKEAPYLSTLGSASTPGGEEERDHLIKSNYTAKLGSVAQWLINIGAQKDPGFSLILNQCKRGREDG